MSTGRKTPGTRPLAGHPNGVVLPVGVAKGSVPVSSRGRLLFPDQVAEEVFSGRKSCWWIRRHVAPEKKLRLGHSTVAWFEADVWAWLEAQRVA